MSKMNIDILGQALGCKKLLQDFSEKEWALASTELNNPEMFYSDPIISFKEDALKELKKDEPDSEKIKGDLQLILLDSFFNSLRDAHASIYVWKRAPTSVQKTVNYVKEAYLPLFKTIIEPDNFQNVLSYFYQVSPKSRTLQLAHDVFQQMISHELPQMNKEDSFSHDSPFD